MKADRNLRVSANTSAPTRAYVHEHIGVAPRRSVLSRFLVLQNTILWYALTCNGVALVSRQGLRQFQIGLRRSAVAACQMICSTVRARNKQEAQRETCDAAREPKTTQTCKPRSLRMQRPSARVDASWLLRASSYTILYYTILYYTILYYTILYYTVLYYAILYYTGRAAWLLRAFRGHGFHASRFMFSVNHIQFPEILNRR